MKLLYAVLHFGKSYMEVFVQDSDGRKRKIEFKWMAKNSPDGPPANWLSAVSQEVEFRRADEVAAAKGRKLPF